MRAFALGTNPLVHVQAVAADTWTIVHDFPEKPGVFVFVAGNEVKASIEYPSSTVVLVKFRQPQSGEARLV